MFDVTLMKYCCNSIDPLLKNWGKKYAALEKNGEKTTIFLLPLFPGKGFVDNFCAKYCENTVKKIEIPLSFCKDKSQVQLSPLFC